MDYYSNINKTPIVGWINLNHQHLHCDLPFLNFKSSDQHLVSKSKAVLQRSLNTIKRQKGQNNRHLFPKTLIRKTNYIFIHLIDPAVTGLVSFNFLPCLCVFLNCLGFAYVYLLCLGLAVERNTSWYLFPKFLYY